ncbi:MAG: anaerobic glycerol-3-phosphate dehydrogenase subunit A [Muribaculaceae bacterium]|nr:anaerobic glycerol-3-phosphate dehydrogenase subunit A [Muribaculaceae bacterium]
MKGINQYDVIVIGGGATGAGTARDCAKRGLKTLLLERFDFTNGATGRNHGLLHSGARYAVTDGESARECIEENMLLRKIASHCVEETDGLFITLPEDDIAYQSEFVEACTAAGIKTEIIDPQDAKVLEPSVNPALIGAVRVPDGAVDPFRLTVANAVDARLHGAELLTYHEVTGLIIENGIVVGVEAFSHKTKETHRYYAYVTINAAGIWGHNVASKAGVTVNMFPAKGSLLVFGHRVNNMVINRCRKPANADILVPGDTICVIGTTSTRVPFEEVDDMRVTREEVDELMREGEMLAPALATTRILRAYAGVRPLVAADNDPSGRSISRGIVCLDHEKRDGLGGFITITGGKLMTYRLMAEWATDLACRKLGNTAECRTAIDCLPGSDGNTEISNEGKTAVKAAKYRHGSFADKIPAGDRIADSLVCECESVTAGEINYAIDHLNVNKLVNLRRRTRMGMGTCQGGLCACRAAGLMVKAHNCAEKAKTDMADFIQERWKGMNPIAWGDTMNEAQFMSWIYEGVCGLNTDVNHKTKDMQ